jgi:hypothetical protein
MGDTQERDLLERMEAHAADMDQMSLAIVNVELRDLLHEAIAEISRLRSELEKARTWQTINSAPTDGTHIIGLTQWGALEVWFKRDPYDGDYWTDEGDSEPVPTHWIPKPEMLASSPPVPEQKD